MASSLAVSPGDGSAASTSRSSGGNSTSTTVNLNLETLHLWSQAVMSEMHRRVSIDTLRPLHVFAGVDPSGDLASAAGAYTPPVQKLDKTTFEKVKTRMKLNGAFYLSNYVLLACMVAVVVALMHPGMILLVAACYGLWSLHYFLVHNQLVLFDLIHVHSVLSIQQRFYILLVCTTLVLCYKCLYPTLYVIAISSTLILSHAFLRDPKHTEQQACARRTAGRRRDEDDDVEGGADSGGNSSGSDSEVLVERPKQ